MKFVDWLARTAMLVLAALATLALIGSLASVSNSAIGDAFPGTIPPSVERPADVVAARPERGAIETGNATMTIEAPANGPASAVAAHSPADRAVVRWFKALTYAVLALAVLAAVGVIALLRIAGHLRRIAER